MTVRILVADTSSKVRKNVARSLNEIGVQNVVVVADANKAIDRLQQEQFNAVLADGKIQAKSGKDFVDEIRHIDSNVPIIVTENQDEVSPAYEAKYPSASGHLAKPFTNEGLRQKLQEFIPTLAS